MSINSISLKNFKCFRDIDIKLSKITLLTGANSSGKSSLLYGILAALQSKDFPFYLSPNGKYVKMGDFDEISFKHLINNEIEINISVKDSHGRDHYVQTVWVKNPKDKLPSLYMLKITSAHLEVEIKKNESYKLNLKYDEAKDTVLDVNAKLAMARFFQQILKMSAKTRQSRKQYEGLADKLIETGDIKNLEFKNINDLLNKLGNVNYFQAYRLIVAIPKIFEHIENSINFISSFRNHPERTYYQGLGPDMKVGIFGENYIQQILEWEINNSNKFQELNSILKNLNLLRIIKTRQLRGGRFEVRTKVSKKGVLVSLADVGFGVSQILPIIVADLQLPKNSMLLVAQPEIHLHPSVQATFGDYFVDQVKKNNKMYIIETHSEYLLNRIRLSIVRGKIKPSEVAIYYFENSVNGSIKHQIEFTKEGQIKNAPKGFFETYMMDVMDIALNA